MFFASHDAVNHAADEYVSFQNPKIHTNTNRGLLLVTFFLGLLVVAWAMLKYETHYEPDRSAA